MTSGYSTRVGKSSVIVEYGRWQEMVLVLRLVIDTLGDGGDGGDGVCGDYLVQVLID